MADKQVKDVFDLICKHIAELETKIKKFTSLQSSDIPIIKDEQFQKEVKQVISNHTNSKHNLKSLKFFIEGTPDRKETKAQWENKVIGTTSITTDIENITAYLKEKYPDMKNFKISGVSLTPAQAQAVENKYIHMGYSSHPVVGITTDIEKRKAYWKQQYPRMKNFKIIASGLTHAQAQKIENEYISQGCEGHPGGEVVSGYVYYVYTFDKS